MQRWNSNFVATYAALLFVAGVLVPATRTFSAPQGSRYGANYFPNISLTTHDGKTVHFYDDLVKGKIVAIDLIYTHCKDMCPLETARLAQVQKMLGDRVGKDIFFYSISIDPKADKPEVLKAYAEKFHAGPGWLFLTGKKEDIDFLSKKIGLYSDPTNRDGHTTFLLLGNDSTGQWMRNSATDNPRFLATLITNFVGDWRDRKPTLQKTYADAPTIKLTHKGQYLFATRCSACHTIGHGDLVGPDLEGVTKSRDRTWLARFIATPDKLLAEKDPTALALFKKYKQVQMPDLRLSDEDIDSLLEYLALPRAEATKESLTLDQTVKSNRQ